VTSANTHSCPDQARRIAARSAGEVDHAGGQAVAGSVGPRPCFEHWERSLVQRSSLQDRDQPMPGQSQRASRCTLPHPFGTVLLPHPTAVPTGYGPTTCDGRQSLVCSTDDRARAARAGHVEWRPVRGQKRMRSDSAPPRTHGATRVQPWISPRRSGTQSTDSAAEGSVNTRTDSSQRVNTNRSCADSYSSPAINSSGRP
jgi:hypothetical protein